MNPREPVRSILLATIGLRVGGGIASVTRSVQRSFEEALEQGQLSHIDIVSLNDSPEACRAYRGEMRTARGSQLLFVAQAWRMLRRNPDLVFMDHLGLGRSFKLPLPGIRPRRTAVFIHGGEFWTIKQGRRESIVQNADYVLTNSRFTGQVVRDHLPTVGAKIHPVPLCIEPDLVSRWEANAPRDEVPREPVVLIVGRMLEEEPGKGHDALIEAWPRISESVPGARLWIAGEGNARQAFERKAAQCQAKGVEFLGKISDDELSLRYRRASLFAMPSRQEGFGLVYAEAMWHGLPCVGSSADAAKEVIRDGETGAIVPYGDPIALGDTLIKLLLDSTLRQKMGESARREATTRFAFPRFRRELLESLGLQSDPGAD